MTSLHEFLAKKRQERNRGKLAGLANQIQELKDLGASYKEIAEYLQLEHGLTVTRSGLQKHLKSLASKRSAQPALEISSPAPGLPAPPAAQPNPLPPIAPLEKASAPDEAFRAQRPIEGDRIQTRAESAAEDVVARYRLGSPEHQAKLAAYRQRKNQSQT
ncbi:DNA-binding transcriptional MerR regulator [Paraburkholderia sp. GAS448]|uniref:hypothetical protein n=1 Tax=Paraburkholderia sp. GAS448 TaxID=3035136 RepID=UPI003D1D4B3D